MFDGQTKSNDKKTNEQKLRQTIQKPNVTKKCKQNITNNFGGCLIMCL